MTGQILKQAPAGPIAYKFTRSRAFIAGIMGPVGSGKTTHCVQRCIQIGLWQNAVRLADRDGKQVRRAKIAVVRDTYPNLDTTVIPTWHRWFPKDVGDWSGNAPRLHKIDIGLGPAGILEIEMIFIAIGDKRVEDVMRGLEVTAIWLNEADRLSFEVLKYALGRVGRYPGTIEGGCAWSGVFCDFNAPDSDNWTYKVFIDKELDPELIAELTEILGDRPLIEFHVQPGGRDPGAENMHNLPKGYYPLQMIGATVDYIRRMIDNKFGAVRSGQPVYPEFRDEFHVSPVKLEPIPKRRIRCGMDGGLTPAAVFKQRDSFGQHRVLRELVVFPGEGEVLETVGPTVFGRALKRFIEDEFPGFLLTDFDFRADPATQDGTDASENERTWIETVAQELSGGAAAWRDDPDSRIRIRVASTNVLDKRLEAVRKPLMALIEGGRPAVIFDPRCKVLRKGMNSGYVYRRVAVGGSTELGRFELKPAKNMFSHVQDALQYAFDEAGSDENSASSFGRPASRFVVETEYSPFGAE